LHAAHNVLQARRHAIGVVFSGGGLWQAGQITGLEQSCNRFPSRGADFNIIALKKSSHHLQVVLHKRGAA
jgi:hypothetical protein